MVEMDQSSKIVLSAIGVLWGTLFSAIAFVLPRLLEVHDTKKNTQSRRMFMIRAGGSDILVSGLSERVTGINEWQHSRDVAVTLDHESGQMSEHLPITNEMQLRTVEEEKPGVQQ